MEEKMRVIVITVFLFIGAAIAENAGIEEEAINPAAEGVGIGLLSKPEAYESPKLKKFITHCTSHVGETCSTTSRSGSEALMQNQDGLALCLFDSMERCLVDQGAQLYLTSVTNHQVVHPLPRVGTLGKVVPFPRLPPRPPSNIRPFPGTPSNVVPFPPRGGRLKSKLDNHQVQPLAPKFRLPPMRPLPPLPKLGPTSPIQRPIPTIPSPPISPEDLSLLIQTTQLRTVLRVCTHVTARTCLPAPYVATSDLEACLPPSMNQCVYPRGAESGSPPIRA